MLYHVPVEAPGRTERLLQLRADLVHRHPKISSKINFYYLSSLTLVLKIIL